MEKAVIKSWPKGERETLDAAASFLLSFLSHSHTPSLLRRDRGGSKSSSAERECVTREEREEKVGTERNGRKERQESRDSDGERERVIER